MGECGTRLDVPEGGVCPFPLTRSEIVNRQVVMSGIAYHDT